MQTRPFLIIPAPVSECSRNGGGGLRRRENKPTTKISNNTFCCRFFSLAPFSHSCRFLSATVPASPSLPQSTWSAVLCSHPQHGGRPSVDGPGESRPGRSRDVGSVAEGEGQAVSGTGAHCIWGEVYFTQNERFIPTLPYRSKACKEQTHHTPLIPQVLVFPCNNSLIVAGFCITIPYGSTLRLGAGYSRWLFFNFRWGIEKDAFKKKNPLFVLTSLAPEPEPECNHGHVKVGRCSSLMTQK